MTRRRVGPVGIFSFGTPPLAHMAPLRVRAMLAEAALQGLDLAFFAGNDCDVGQSLVDASRFDAGRWEKRRVALPPLVVIINEPIRPADHDIARWLRSHTSVIADHAPDKGHLPVALAESPFASNLIPGRVVDGDRFAEELTAWLERTGASVVKPIDGMRGGGVRRIEPVDGEWQVRYRDKACRGPLAAIVDRVRRDLSGRLHYRQYMVQRYVASNTADGRAAALRVDLQKRADGQWTVLRQAARIGEIGRVVTNLAQGGYQGTAIGFLSGRQRGRAEELHSELLSLGLGIAAHLDQSGAASIMELGVDFLIDDEDRFWLLEVNARPDNPTTELERAFHLIGYLRSHLP